MHDETPEQNQGLHHQALVRATYYNGMIAWRREKLAEQKRQAHIDQLKTMCGIK